LPEVTENARGNVPRICLLRIVRATPEGFGYA